MKIIKMAKMDGGDCVMIQGAVPAEQQADPHSQRGLHQPGLTTGDYFTSISLL
jgi:hypothetical protein